jgi:uncharacterized cupin superfamily protein
MNRPFPAMLRIRADEIDREPMELDPETVLEGDPDWQMAIFWRNPDNTALAGSFRSTPGRFTYVSTATEFITLLEGHVVITGPDGTSIEARAGDFIVAEGGKAYEYDVRETMVDFVVVTGPDPIEY